MLEKDFSQINIINFFFSFSFNHSLNIEFFRLGDKLDKAFHRAKEHQQLIKEFGEGPVTQPKLFVCGAGGVGKTTLVSALSRTAVQQTVSRVKHKLFGRRKSAEEDVDSIDNATRGIDIKCIKLKGSTPCKYSVWDLAGQVCIIHFNHSY